MDRLSDHSFILPNRGWLPSDIVSQIIEEFVLDLRFFGYDRCLDHESVSELLRLRLVSKTWSEAIIPFAFHTVQLHTSKGIQLIIDNWSKIQAPDLPCPVKRLMIQDQVYLRPNDWERRCPISLDQAAILIELIGGNLNELTLLFSGSFGISQSLVKAISHIKHLKKLNLQDDEDTATRKDYDPLLLSNLFDAIPKLEAFTLKYVHAIISEVKPLVLSTLKYFNFKYFDGNRDAIAHICQAAKESMRIIEYRGEIQEPELVFGPIANTLEGLFTFSLTDDITQSTIDLKLPKLRLLRTRFGQEADDYGMYENPILFLKWPIFHTIRTLVLDIDEGPYHLEEHLQHMGRDPFRKTPNLKHVIFIMSEGYKSCPVVPSKLVKDLKSHGIDCHSKPESNPEELMELDLKLNGAVIRSS
ncbi:uncharacterized protein MELLADRAFT_63958 [Melampsora larici-populina 98AG31]|uniref:F-box domain-containing protein n=1 Tax=Melampsora larici-populina (strain 98AG31 / pathotype 3-4-7) TaxID=747676 RepID=F4RPM4_MELLP|nr:uncharacterized protein MELLADRAFT_63958 [Melampsora larici-populina 98AG31]EGG05701.1 hypothetical protein MELLADRAFT_63958 [Melampsora larici-populina 98AG31]